MKLYADKNTFGDKAEQARLKHEACMFFSENASFSLRMNMMQKGSAYAKHFRAIKSYMKDIELATESKNIPFETYTFKRVYESVRKIRSEFELFSEELINEAISRIRNEKLSIVSGMANSAGIDHITSSEIIKMIVYLDTEDSRAAHKEGGPRPEVNHEYNQIELRTELKAIRAIEREIDTRNPEYANSLDLPPYMKRTLALQEIVNFGMLQTGWDEDMLGLSLHIAKSFYASGQASEEAVYSMVSDISSLLQVYALSFERMPNDPEPVAIESMSRKSLEYKDLGGLLRGDNRKNGN